MLSVTAWRHWHQRCQGLSDVTNWSSSFLTGRKDLKHVSVQQQQQQILLLLSTFYSVTEIHPWNNAVDVPWNVWFRHYCLNALIRRISVLTDIVNDCLSTDSVPDSLKPSGPKKASLAPNILVKFQTCVKDLEQWILFTIETLDSNSFPTFTLPVFLSFSSPLMWVGSHHPLSRSWLVILRPFILFLFLKGRGGRGGRGDGGEGGGVDLQSAKE